MTPLLKKRKRGNGNPLSSRSILSDFFDIDRFFEGDWLNNHWMSKVPAANITEKSGAFDIELAVPGMTKKDFEIEVDNGVLTISSEKEEEQEEQGERFTRQEYSYNSFARSFTLPESVDADQIEAHYENGVLKLTLPKKEEAKKKSKKSVKVK